MKNTIFDLEQEYERCIKESDLLCEGYYLFNLDWDMERCETPYKVKDKPYIHSPNKDGEWVYQFARMEYLHKLIIANRLTKDNKYLNTYFKIVEQFFKRNNARRCSLKSCYSFSARVFARLKRLMGLNNVKYPTYRTLDTAIRNYAISIDFYNIKDYECASKEKIRSRMASDFKYAVNNIRKFDETSNWGIIILSLSCAFCLINEEYDLIEPHIQKLVNMLRIQVRKNGSHIENSLMYHNQVLLCLLRLVFWSKKRGYRIDNFITETAKRMALYSYAVADPDEYQIQYGDSDYTPLTTLLYVAAQVLELKSIKIINVPSDIYLLYEFNMKAQSEITVKANCDNKNNNLLLDNSWIYNSSGFSIRVFNDTSSSAHNHADNSAPVIFFDKSPVFADCGRYSYCDRAKYDYYRGRYAHNVMWLDNGNEWEISKGSFLHFPKDIKNSVLATHDALTAFNSSYCFPGLGFKYSRFFYLLNKDTLLIISMAFANGCHRFFTNWNTVCECSYFSDKAIELNSLSIKSLFMSTSDGFSIEKGSISYAYNRESHSKRIVTKSRFTNVGVQAAVISKSVYDISYNETAQSLKLTGDTDFSLKYNKDGKWIIEKLS